MTNPQTQHASTADINAILAARKNAVIEHPGYPATIPALPPHSAPVPNLQAQAVTPPLTQPAAIPIVQVAPTPTVDDNTVFQFLDAHLPDLIAKTRAVTTPPFHMLEVVNLGIAVSQAVKDGLPEVQGQEARALVVVVTRYLWRNYATPLLPPYVQPFAGMLESFIITGIEEAYQLIVKKGGAK